MEYHFRMAYFEFIDESAPFSHFKKHIFAYMDGRTDISKKKQLLKSLQDQLL